MMMPQRKMAKLAGVIVVGMLATAVVALAAMHRYLHRDPGVTFDTVGPAYLISAGDQVCVLVQYETRKVMPRIASGGPRLVSTTHVVCHVDNGALMSTQVSSGASAFDLHHRLDKVFMLNDRLFVWSYKESLYQWQETAGFELVSPDDISALAERYLTAEQRAANVGISESSQTVRADLFDIHKADRITASAGEYSYVLTTDWIGEVSVFRLTCEGKGSAWSVIIPPSSTTGR